MNDEIKEILQELKEKNETYKECGENGIIENEYYKSHILLDYITNLQEENEKLNMQNDLMEQNIEDLQDIKNKAIEYLEKSKLNQLNTCCKYLHVDYDTGKIENIDNLLNILKGE